MRCSTGSDRYLWSHVESQATCGRDGIPTYLQRSHLESQATCRGRAWNSNLPRSRVPAATLSVLHALQWSVMTTNLILGTAGHIDHGKTSLVRAMTGVDTDRLPEERTRGITIDLGFAELCVGDYRLGIVDVPGHERFVRNMLAGATGMDLALLVVAADDSIKPQTREHLDILRLLDLKVGLIALTKCDLVEPDWIDLVEEEVRELVADSFLEGAPMSGPAPRRGLGSKRCGASWNELRGERSEFGPRESSMAPFRLAIDRAFTIAGHGTVVTGSVGSGSARLGDELVIEPGGLKVRIRGLHNHDRTTDQVQRGQRAAINLAGIHHERIERGQELASAGHLRPSRLLSVQIHVVSSARDRSRIAAESASMLARPSYSPRWYYWTPTSWRLANRRRANCF